MFAIYAMPGTAVWARVWAVLVVQSVCLNAVQCFKNTYFDCNYNEFQSGCADRMGSQCDRASQKCVCKADFTVRLGEFCLQQKTIGDNCYTSAQCNHIPKAGCFNFREEFNDNPSRLFGTHQIMWPSGVCRCKNGHYFNVESKTCVHRVIGSWCSNVWDCRSAEDKRSTSPYICERNECKCSADHRYNATTDDCHYIETQGMACSGKNQCVWPTVCANKTCHCAANYHLEAEKTPKCQPNNNLNDIRSEGSLDVAKGDRTFEIFILTIIPLVIIFLTLKPCLKKFGKCKPRTDEVVRGSKEISIKCTDYDKDIALNQHKFCEKLQTIEEVGEDVKVRDEEEVIVDQAVVRDNSEADEDKSGPDGKSIGNELTKDNGVQQTKDANEKTEISETTETSISPECSANS